MKEKKMPHDIKMECVYICKGYKRRCRDYARQYTLLNNTVSPLEQLKNPEIMKLLAVKQSLAHQPLIGNLLLANISLGTPYEHLDVPMGRSQFYCARNDFLAQIARFMGYF